MILSGKTKVFCTITPRVLNISFRFKLLISIVETAFTNIPMQQNNCPFHSAENLQSKNLFIQIKTKCLALLHMLLNISNINFMIIPFQSTENHKD